jgi:hypothetical protein
LEEITKLRPIELVREDYKDQVIAFYTKQQAEKTPLTYLEFPIITKEKKNVWLGQNVQLIFKDGVYLRSQVVARVMKLK